MRTYQVIYADPCWQHRDAANAGKRGARHKYKTMTLKELAALPVVKLAADNSVCLMWAVSPLLQEAFYLLNAWGFSYRTIAFSWTKLNAKPLSRKALLKAQLAGRQVIEYQGEWYTTKMGMGYHTRSNVEMVLLGVRGKGLKRVRNDIRQEIIAPIREPSRKPDEVRTAIEHLYGEKSRIELFARQRFRGWHAFGNEVKSTVNLNKMKKVVA